MACKSAALRTLPDTKERACETCGTVFAPRRDRPAARYCSKKCSGIGLANHPHDEQWFAAIRAAAIISGNRQRGKKGVGKAYRKLNGRHEHRVVAEEKIGRPLRFEDVVHHIDGDILNNDPSNLEIMTRAEHMREHGLGIPGVAPAHEPWRNAKAAREKKKNG